MAEGERLERHELPRVEALAGATVSLSVAISDMATP